MNPAAHRRTSYATAGCAARRLAPGHAAPPAPQLPRCPPPDCAHVACRMSRMSSRTRTTPSTAPAVGPLASAARRQRFWRGAWPRPRARACLTAALLPFQHIRWPDHGPAVYAAGGYGQPGRPPHGASAGELSSRFSPAPAVLPHPSLPLCPDQVAVLALAYPSLFRHPPCSSPLAAKCALWAPAARPPHPWAPTSCSASAS